MLLRISASELKEIAPKNKNTTSSIWDMEIFYAGRILVDTIDYKKYLLNKEYVRQLANYTGDKRTRGGKLGKKDYKFVRDEMKCL